MTPAAGVSTDPTMAQMFQRMLDRDEQFRDSQAQLAAKVSDLSTATQAVQSEIHRLVKLAERQDGYNERQIALAEQTADHAKTFDRAFRQMEEHKSEWSRGIDGLADELKRFGDVVIGYRGSLGAMKWMIGLGFPALLLGIGFAYTVLIEKITESRSEAARATNQLEMRHERDMTAAQGERNDLRGQLRELQSTRTLK